MVDVTEMISRMLTTMPRSSGDEIVKYYGLFDAEGKTGGFWASDIFPPRKNGDRNPEIPAAAIEISYENWKTMVANQQTARFVNGEVTYPLSAQLLGSAEYDWGATVVETVGRS